MADKKWVKVSDAARMLSVSKGTIRYWINVQGYFTSIRRGNRYLVLASEVRRYAREGMADDSKAPAKTVAKKVSAASDIRNAKAAAKGGRENRG